MKPKLGNPSRNRTLFSAYKNLLNSRAFRSPQTWPWWILS